MWEHQRQSWRAVRKYDAPPTRTVPGALDSPLPQRNVRQEKDVRMVFDMFDEEHTGEGRRERLDTS